MVARKPPRKFKREARYNFYEDKSNPQQGVTALQLFAVRD